MKENSNKKILLEMMHKVGGMPLNEDGLTFNMRKNSDGNMTINKPVVDDAITILSKNPKAIKVNTKGEFDNIASKQKYFSASYSHAFNTMEDYNKKNNNGESIILFETGRELVQVWDNDNQIGYILPK